MWKFLSWAQRNRSVAPTVGDAMLMRPRQGRYGMMSALAVSLVVGLMTGSAYAQSAQGLFWQCATNGGQPQYCPVNNQFPLPHGAEYQRADSSRRNPTRPRDCVFDRADSSDWRDCGADSGPGLKHSQWGVFVLAG